MTYKIKVDKQSPAFQPLVNIITEVRGVYGKPGMSIRDIKDIIKKDYGIVIEDFISTHEKPYTLVDFDNKENYLLCILKWT